MMNGRIGLLLIFLTAGISQSFAASDAERNYAFRSAAHKSDITTMRTMLADTKNPVTKSTLGEALSEAIHRNCTLETVELLLDAGADPAATDLNGYSALHRAIFKRYSTPGDYLLALIKRKPNFNPRLPGGHTGPKYPPMHEIARSCGSLIPQIIDAAREAGLDLRSKDKDGKTLYDILAPSVCRRHAYSCLPEEAQQQSRALHAAAASGNVDEIHRLLSQGVSVDILNEDGHTPLLTAACSNQAAAIDALLCNKANIRHATDRDGNTPLHLTSNLACAQLLVEKEPSLLNLDNEGNISAFRTQLEKNNESIARFLLTAGALSFNRQDTYGDTPLHYAAQHLPNLVPDLLEHGANPTIKNSHNEIPADIAADEHTRSMLNNMLQETTANSAQARRNMALQVSVVNNNQSEVERLLAAGAHATQQHICSAIEKKNSSIVASLLNAGALAHKSGFSDPLSTAHDSGASDDIFELLVQAGATSEYHHTQEIQERVSATRQKIRAQQEAREEEERKQKLEEYRLNLTRESEERRKRAEEERAQREAAEQLQHAEQERIEQEVKAQREREEELERAQQEANAAAQRRAAEQEQLQKEHERERFEQEGIEREAQERAQEEERKKTSGQQPPKPPRSDASSVDQAPAASSNDSKILGRVLMASGGVVSAKLIWSGLHKASAKVTRQLTIENEVRTQAGQEPITLEGYEYYKAVCAEFVRNLPYKHRAQAAALLVALTAFGTGIYLEQAAE